MRLVLGRGIVVLGFVLALAPISAFAETPDQAVLTNAANQAAIDAIKAQAAWMQNMPPMEQGVAHGQFEIANAKAIAKLLPFNTNVQTNIPNSMQMYSILCDTAIAYVDGSLANARAMASAKPFDMHAQSELANAMAIHRMLWSIIGDTYPGNPYAVMAPPRPPVVAEVIADDEGALVAEATEEDVIMAEDVLGDAIEY